MTGDPIRLSDLKRENRWDAGFHIALKSVSEETERLRLHYTASDAKRLVDTMGLDDKRRIAVLVRGNVAFNEATSRKVTAEYPHLALALVASHLGDVVDRIRTRIAEDESRLEQLLELESAVAQRA